MKCRWSVEYSERQVWWRGVFRRVAEAQVDSVDDKGTLSRTTGDGAHVEPEFNIFTDPHAKPSGIAKFLSNFPKSGDWLNMDFGPATGVCRNGRDESKPL